MKCSTCGRTDTMLMTGINELTQQSDLACLICQMRDALRDGDNLNVIDENIENSVASIMIHNDGGAKIPEGTNYYTIEKGKNGKFN